MKVCRNCNIEKDESEFPKIRAKKNNFNKFGSNKLDTRCKACKAAQAREWRKKHPGYRGTGAKSKYAEKDKLLVSAIRTKIAEAKQNNKRQKRNFDIDLEYMFDLYKKQNGKCYLTDFNLKVEKNNPYALSIDKIEPEKGYTKGNVKWSCWMANRAKSDLNITELEILCKAIVVKCNDYRKAGKS